MIQAAPVHSSLGRNRPPLGIHAKSAAAIGDPAAIQRELLRGTVHDESRREVWKLHRAAARLLADKEDCEGRDGQGAYVRFKYRIAMCQRGLAGDGKGSAVEIKRNAAGTKSRFEGLQTCGSVWHCPICAPKIARERCDEITQAILKHQEQGGGVLFMTMTRQHGRVEGGLADHRQELARAMSKCKGSRAWREAMAAAGYIGAVRAQEVTYGEANGWHAHTHDILFAGADPDYSRQARLQRRLRGIWARQLIKDGLAGLLPGDIGIDLRRKLRALLTRCLTVQPGGYAADYVAKFGREPSQGWGLGSELTRSHLKTARRAGHCSPWGLLADYCEGDKRSGELWREYALTFHGKAQLFWSKGLRARFGLDLEETDEEIAAKPEPECSLHVAFVGYWDWRMVIAMDARFDLLRAAAIDGPDGVRVYLRELREAHSQSPPGRSDFVTMYPGERLAA